MDTSTKYSPVGTKAYWLPGPAIPAEAATRKLAVGGPGYMAFTLRAVQVVVPKRLRDAFFRASPQAVLTSSVQVGYPGLGQLEGRAIRWVQPVQRDRANRLGLQLGLVDWIPAIFPQARFSIEVTLSASNRLGPLIALTKDDDLATVASAFTGREYTGDAGNIFSVVSTKTRSLTPGEGYILASGLRAYEQETHVASSTLPSLGAPLSRLHTAR